MDSTASTHDSYVFTWLVFSFKASTGGGGSWALRGKSHSSISEVHSRGWRFLSPQKTRPSTQAPGATIKKKSVGEKWMFQAGKQYITSL